MINTRGTGMEGNTDNDLFNLLFKLSSQTITITTLEEGVYVDVNPAFEKTSGYSREEVIGKTASDIHIWADDIFRKNFVEQLKTDKVTSKIETRFRRKDGTIGYTFISAKIITCKQTLCILGFFEDISRQKEQEESFKQAINNLPLGIFRSTAGGQMHSANPAMARIFGFGSVEEILRRPVTEYYINADERNTLLKKLERKGTFSENTRKRKKDGTEIWVSNNYKIIYNKNHEPEYIEGIVEDITERRKTEDSLRESEEKFRQLFENNYSILILTDPKTKLIIDGNAAAARFCGCSPEKLKTLSIEDCIMAPPEDIDSEIQRIKKEKGSFLTAKIKMPDGSTRKVNINSGIINTSKGEILYGFIHDITEQVHTQERFEIFNEALKQSFSGVVITRKDETIEYINPAFTRMSGYTSEEVIGKTPRVLKSGLMSPAVYQELWNRILASESWSGELINKRKNGEIYWEKATISPIVDKEGNITHFIAINDDITEQKKLIQDLVIAKEKAEESNKLKSAFLSNMSHEIRTPLNSIIGFTDLFLSDDITKDQQEEFKRYIHESTDQLLSVINDVLDMSLLSTRQISVFSETFDINTFINEVSTNFVQSIQDKGLKFSVEKMLENGLCQINSDFTRLKQIFEKLFNNAIKYTQKGEITFGYEHSDRGIRIYIRDTGIGISKNRQDKIYESFSQETNELTRKFGGLGLGLTIAKRICELLGFDLQFDSTPGEGSVFYVVIPKYNCNILSVDSVSGKNNCTENALLPSKIMIIENDTSSFEYLKTIIEKFGIEIIHVKSADEVLSCFKKNKDIQLVIMNIQVPHLNGWLAIKLLKEFNSSLPVIALSESTQDGDLQRAQLSGADMFLTKPTRPEILMKHIIHLTSKKAMPSVRKV